MMTRLVVAPALTRWLPQSSAVAHGELALEFSAANVGELLDMLFQQHPSLRGYILDEHDRVRHHVAVFLDGQALRDKQDLKQPVTVDGEVYVMQALSGG